MTEDTLSLTSDPPREKLEEHTIMGHTVWVSQSSEKAYVEHNGELISYDNVLAWNQLLERAKVTAIDGYERENSVIEKHLEKERERVAKRLMDMGTQLRQLGWEVQDE